jgi:D-aminopeptidase
MTESKTNDTKTGVAALDDLFQPLNRSDAPGLVVGVAQHGKTVYRRGFGMASLEHAVANTPWTRMLIASTSKHFTSVAALLLAEDGKLDIDASVRTYLPELPVLKGEPTLRQLLTHTGGYRCYLDVGFMSDGMAIKPKGTALAVQVRQGDVNFAPGDKMIYNNGGYQLVSLVIERVSGMSFERFLQERIFTPLAMINSASVPSDFEIHPGVATLHTPVPPEQGGGWRRGIFPSEEGRGDGATITTVDDMLRWLAHLRSPHKIVGSAHSWQQMLAPTTLNSGLVNPYGLGLMRHGYRGLQVIHHAGGAVGGSCQMITVPSQALDIIIIINGAPVSPMEMGYKVIDAMLGDTLPAPPEPRAEAAHFRPMLGTRYHARESGLVFGFSEGAEGRLGLNFLNGPPVPLRDEGELLRLGFEDLAIGPLALNTAQLARDGAAPATLELRESGRGEHFERLPETPPALAEAGAPLVGRYQAPDLDAEARVRLDGGKLSMQVFGSYGTNHLELEALSADVFAFRSTDPSLPLFGVLGVERNQGRVTALRMNTWRTRHMKFERLAD